MKLIFLHGAPASGKLTTAKALLRAVPGRLFDNHASIDVARTVFDFDAPGFWELVLSIRVQVLSAAVEHNVPLVVMTFVYVEPEDLPKFEQYEAIIQRFDGQVLPVFLDCSNDTLIGRVGNADRVERRKLASEDGIKTFLAEHTAVPIPRQNCLRLNSDRDTAEANAEKILAHFGLRDS